MGIIVLTSKYIYQQYKLVWFFDDRFQLTKTINMNTLITVVVTLIIVGLVLWLINRFIPMAGSIKSILNVVVVIAVILWLLKVFNIWSGHFGSV
jgi:hypothetical protein